jgi:hypothetical protein
MDANTTWPDGVVARYLTVGGATVDIRPTHNPEWDDRHEATCTGCAANDWQPYLNSPLNDLARARTWAQAHAETCRAMPAPTN